MPTLVDELTGPQEAVVEPVEFAIEILRRYQPDQLSEGGESHPHPN